MVLLAVHVPPDRLRLPLHREHMKIVAESLPVGQREWRADAVRPGVSRAVDRAVHRGRLAPDILHDVDLAAVGPSRGNVAHHPERRPDPLPVRYLDARFEPAVSLREFALRLNPRRGEAALDPIGPAVRPPSRPGSPACRSPGRGSSAGRCNTPVLCCRTRRRPPHTTHFDGSSLAPSNSSCQVNFHSDVCASAPAAQASSVSAGSSDHASIVPLIPASHRTPASDSNRAIRRTPPCVRRGRRTGPCD